MDLALKDYSRLITRTGYVFILWAILANYAVFSQSKKTNSFSLIGQVARPSSGTIYLLDQANKPVASVRLKAGRFVIKGVMPEPGLYLLQIDTVARKYPIFLDALPIQIHIQPTGTYQVKGSRLHTQWERYTNHINQSREQLIKLYQQRSTAQQTGDSLLYNHLLKQNDSISIEYGSFLRQQIAQRPYSFFNLYLLKKADLSDAYSANMLREFKPSLSAYPTFQSLSQELKNKATQQQRIAIGQQAYNFNLPDSSGVMYSLETLRKTNKVILLDFWASWCGPCLKELPVLKALHKQFAPQGLALVGISIDSNPTQWQKALATYQPAGLQLLAKEKSVLVANYVVYGVPQIFLIDQDGRIQAHDLHGDDLSKKLSALLSK